MDNLLLQALMGMDRLQIRPTRTRNPPFSFFPHSLEDLLFNDGALGLDGVGDEDEDDGNMTSLAREEAKLEREIIRIIVSGQSDYLRANSGQAVTVADHHVCVGFHIEAGSEYRVWEWHGHIMIFDDENGYTPEYIYGNYFEKLPMGSHPLSASDKEEKSKEKEKEKEKDKEKEKSANLGLRELIGGGDSGQARVLHRNINASSSRFIYIFI